MTLFAFRGAKSHEWTFCDPIKVDDFAKSHQRAPGGAPESMTGNVMSLICKESENDTFRFPWSKKQRMDFLRPYQDCVFVIELQAIFWILNSLP